MILLVQERMIKHSQSHKHEHPFLYAQNLISDVLHFTRIAKTNYRKRVITRCEPPETVAPPLTDQTTPIDSLC